MARLISRLVLVLALLAMPLGMAAAPAKAAAGHHGQHQSAAQHCPDQAPEPLKQSSVLVDCAMACSAALPAGEAPPAGPTRFDRARELPGSARRLSSLVPDTDTPPPRPS